MTIIHLASGAGIRINDLLNMSYLPLPLHQGLNLMINRRINLHCLCWVLSTLIGSCKVFECSNKHSTNLCPQFWSWDWNQRPWPKIIRLDRSNLGNGGTVGFRNLVRNVPMYFVRPKKVNEKLPFFFFINKKRENFEIGFP